MRFANFLGRSPELVPKPPFACKYYTRPLKERAAELILDSFLESSRTSLALVWFAGTPPDLRGRKVRKILDVFKDFLGSQEDQGEEGQGCCILFCEDICYRKGIVTRIWHCVC